MSASCTQTIISQMLAALTGATDVGERVFDSRKTAIERDELPCIAIESPDNEDSKKFSEWVDQNTVTITVEILVRGDPWRTVSDPIAVQVHRILMADPVLLSLVTEIRKTGRKWDGKDADATAGSDALQYSVTYLSSARDLGLNLT
jgi:hypothetical protein